MAERLRLTYISEWVSNSRCYHSINHEGKYHCHCLAKLPLIGTEPVPFPRLVGHSTRSLLERLVAHRLYIGASKIHLAIGDTLREIQIPRKAGVICALDPRTAC